MNRFTGNYNAKTDSKGRVFIPAAFRKVLQISAETQLIMRKDIFQDCLVLYPESVWNEEINFLRSKLSKWDKEQSSLFRTFVTDSEIMEMDSNGRILIPKRYLLIAGISSEVRFIGMDNTIELWSREKIDSSSMKAEEFQKGIEKWMNV